MKAIQISRTGGSDVLELAELATPQPGPGEVLIEAQAIGVNLFDLLIRSGRYRWMPKLPFIPGNEMSGHVVATGPDTHRFQIGQPVFVAGYDIGNRGGLYAEYAAVPEAAAWPLPEDVDLDAAVALTNYQLAWILLHQAARGIEARTVLVYGAAGGVGTALVDIARLAGAEVIAVAGSAEKCDFVRERGNARIIDHSSENIVERVLDITGGRGVDVIFDHVAGKRFTDGVKMLAPLGMIVSYGLLGGLPQDELFAAMRGELDRSPAVRCFTMHTYDHMPERRREAMARVIGLYGSGAFHPAIGAKLPLADARRAHDLIESRVAMGKLLLKPTTTSA